MGSGPEDHCKEQGIFNLIVTELYQSGHYTLPCPMCPSLYVFSSISFSHFAMTPLLLSEFLGVISRNSAECVTWSFHRGIRDTAMPPPQAYQTEIISECCASLLLPGPLGVHTPKELPPLPWNVCPPSWPLCVSLLPHLVCSRVHASWLPSTIPSISRKLQTIQVGFLNLAFLLQTLGKTPGGLELVQFSEATRGERTDIRVGLREPCPDFRALACCCSRVCRACPQLLLACQCPFPSLFLAWTPEPVPFLMGH